MASKDSGNWCLIESDPGVFTEIMKGFGVSGLECEEVIDLDEMSNLAEPYGIVFLYKWEKETNVTRNLVTDESVLEKIFFAKQVITNACATQAILNVLFNLQDINLGTILKDLKEFCTSFDAQTKGLTISNSDEIRKVHNSFSNNTLYEVEDKKYHGTEDTYHFIGYMPIDGHLYELDGLQDGPIDLGAVETGQSWITSLKPVILERMRRHTNTYFNMMAIVPEKLTMLEKQLELLKEAGDPESKTQELMSSIKIEKMKHEKYRIENIRRKHNYMPLIVELMKILAEDGKLTGLIEKAEEISNNRKKNKTENVVKMEVE